MEVNHLSTFTEDVHKHNKDCYYIYTTYTVERLFKTLLYAPVLPTFVNIDNENIITVRAHITNLKTYNEETIQLIYEESDKIDTAVLKCNESKDEVLL